MFLRSSVDMIKVLSKDLDCAETGAISWTLSVLATVLISRNWNSWFIATIASLNTVAKTFAKIAKTFVGLSATIIATRRRPVLILHLEAKYGKIDCKNEIYAKNWVRSTWTAKVNSGKKSQRLKSTLVNGQVNSWSMMTSADVDDDDSRWRGSDDVT